MMPFIRVVPPDDAQGPVREMYDKVREQMGYVPNHTIAFSLHPLVRERWVALQAAIKENMTLRSFELATLAAARALRSSYCSLAHGMTLADKVFDAAGVTAIMTDAASAPIEPRERAMMAFAEKVVRNADRITAADVDVLRGHGYQDAEIFDIIATAAARCFFSKILDATGVLADAKYNDIDPALRDALTVGRPVADGRA